jgi:hypothetical protein
MADAEQGHKDQLIQICGNECWMLRIKMKRGHEASLQIKNRCSDIS